ncbi:unnamed protein product [Medioppia subpectinata]|uniref:Fucosyltransferase n=1 Tax=Medioppia subpectinata TaxID=1979941 RepID=A0A7R9KHQ4_9ACAR|nr:unnamed protein product [Medioppia subpectinata]CAG2103856.1 unnamed protein product [Medioppia subpectinata]
MPRITLTRVILVVILITCVTLLAVDVWFELQFINSVNTSQHNNELNHNQLIVSAKEPKDAPKHSSLHNSVTNDLIDGHLNERSLNGLNGNTNRHNYRLNVLNHNLNADKPWFMANGSRRPTSRMADALALWPEDHTTDHTEDRIVNQLMYFPADYKPSSNELKKIVLYLGRGGWNDVPMGRTKFVSDKCPVDRCFLTSNAAEAPEADAIFFKERFQWPKHRRPMHQIWILFLLECPLHTQLFTHLGHRVFNWTATYRHDSDIVAPYEKFVPYSQTIPKQSALKNWAEGKTKEVAWFVSNCGARNKRLEYARELSRYIEVDIYGSHNSLDYNLIPIVMGAHPDDYRRSSPPNSYIHVDNFESPKALANYLHILSANPQLYNKYFEWKSSGEFINTYFWCRVCALLHSKHSKPSRGYQDISNWWSPQGICNNGQHNWAQESHH